MNSSKNKERQYLQVCCVDQKQDQAKHLLLQGIEENLALISQLYGPAWSMRVYYNLDDDEHCNAMSFLCRLLQQSTFTIIMFSVQIGLQQPCIGPLPSLKPAWQPKSQPHPNVSQVRDEVLWGQSLAKWSNVSEMTSQTNRLPFWPCKKTEFCRNWRFLPTLDQQVYFQS